MVKKNFAMISNANDFKMSEFENICIIIYSSNKVQSIMAFSSNISKLLKYGDRVTD